MSFLSVIVRRLAHLPGCVRLAYLSAIPNSPLTFFLIISSFSMLCINVIRQSIPAEKKREKWALVSEQMFSSY